MEATCRVIIMFIVGVALLFYGMYRMLFVSKFYDVLQHQQEIQTNTSKFCEGSDFFEGVSLTDFLDSPRTNATLNERKGQMIS